MAAQRIHTAASSSNIAEHQLQDRCGAYDLRTESVLRPADRVNDRCRFLRIAVLANRSEQVSGFKKLIFRDAGDALDHFRCVARILLLQKLEDRPRMLQRKIVGNVRRQHWRWFCSALPGRSWSTSSLMTTAFRTLFGIFSARTSARGALFVLLGLRIRRCGGRSRSLHLPAFFIVPHFFVVCYAGRVEAGEQTIFRKFESVFNDECSVGVV